MTERQQAIAVGGFGALTALVLAAGAGTVGGLMALVILCCLVGAPLAMLVADELRSRAAVVVVAIALSIAIAAIAAQSLIWFDLALAELIVLLATVYGLVLAQLMGEGRASADPAGEVGRW